MQIDNTEIFVRDLKYQFSRADIYKATLKKKLVNIFFNNEEIIFDKPFTL